MSSKTALIIVGILLILMGAAALVPAWTMATEPTWHSIAKIVIGLIAVVIGATEKKTA